ncbi:DapH/DapD/GlmU-related protein [Thiomicrorhabdus sp. Milos-T2]|uniref:DapH/DapD/GlmU-related protein n=1 Tax=Thiomicrorhabdus sp. Milos-T2 TaxID=90814 RepID=UPI000494C397|nr:DapH/DapD/GlmU-related protein [Thiomicrorhabdus sp. Milos-T2]
MSSVDLRKAYSLLDLQTILSSLGVNSALESLEEFEVNAISDGRMPTPNSFCFIEKVGSLAAEEKVLYLSSQPLEHASFLMVDDPRYAFIKLLSYFENQNLAYSLLPKNRDLGIHTSAMIHPRAIIENDVVVGKHTIVAAGCVLKKGTVLGDNCIVRENTVIGCEGITLYKAQNGEVLRFPHLSGVEIGSNVEIGANSVIVRGTLKTTKIEDNVVIGNLCNIGHGVTVKDKVWMSVGTLIGGNCLVEKNSTIGLGVSIKDNLNISENTSVGMGSVVTKSTDENTSYFGSPAKPLRGLKTGPKR